LLQIVFSTAAGICNKSAGEPCGVCLAGRWDAEIKTKTKSKNETENLIGPLSAVSSLSTPTLESKEPLESASQDLHNTRHELFQNSEKISAWHIAVKITRSMFSDEFQICDDVQFSIPPAWDLIFADPHPTAETLSPEDRTSCS
jgi:hypothetical protein